MLEGHERALGIPEMEGKSIEEIHEYTIIKMMEMVSEQTDDSVGTSLKFHHSILSDPKMDSVTKDISKGEIEDLNIKLRDICNARFDDRIKDINLLSIAEESKLLIIEELKGHKEEVIKRLMEKYKEN